MSRTSTVPKMPNHLPAPEKKQQSPAEEVVQKFSALTFRGKAAAFREIRKEMALCWEEEAKANDEQAGFLKQTREELLK